jgi:DNA repair protein SbcD/Mre11
VLVTVEDHQVVGVPEHIQLDAVRWFRAEIDISDLPTRSALHQRLAIELERAHSGHSDGKPLMVRIVLQGESELHNDLVLKRDLLREEVRAVALAVSDAIWVEKVVLATSPPSSRSESDLQADDELQTLIQRGVDDPEVAGALEAELGEFLAKIPPDLGSDQELISEIRRGNLTALLRDASASLISRVAGKAG